MKPRSRLTLLGLMHVFIHFKITFPVLYIRKEHFPNIKKSKNHLVDKCSTFLLPKSIDCPHWLTEGDGSLSYDLLFLIVEHCYCGMLFHRLFRWKRQDKKAQCHCTQSLIYEHLHRLRHTMIVTTVFYRSLLCDKSH